MHLKRQRVPKNWPVKRKGNTYVIKGNFNFQKGIPILVLLRDLLGVAKNRKEVKRIIHAKNILHNNKLVTDEKNTVTLFDTITLIPSKEYYKITLSEKGVFIVEKISEKDSINKISKVVNKKMLKGKKIQLNLSDGYNFISSLKCNTNDSVIIDFKKGKVEKCLPLKEKSTAFVLAGKHTGKKGTIEKVNSKEKMVELKSNKEKIHALIKQIMVTN